MLFHNKFIETFFRRTIGGALIVALLTLAGAQPTRAVTVGAIITVNTTGDNMTNDSSCSIREALTAANSNAPVNGADDCNHDGSTGLDIIIFDIGADGSNQTINMIASPTTISDPVSIDGGNGGGGATPHIRLHGPGGAPTVQGLMFDPGSEGSVVHRMILTNFFVGVYIAADQVTVTSSYIGTSTGTAAVPNDTGIAIDSSSSRIGGPADLGLGNVISGNNDEGISINSGAGNLIVGNMIGLSATGETDLGNGGDGIELFNSAEKTQIGDDLPGYGNVISGNGGYGVFAHDGGGTRLQRNKIGTDGDGLSAIPNDLGGILLGGALKAVIGGKLGLGGNLISGNTNAGIEFSGVNSAATVTGNAIGVASDGSPLPNGDYGVSILNDSVVKFSNNLFANHNAGADSGLAYSVNADLSATSGKSNCFENNVYGIIDFSTAIPNFAKNWWGAADGPGPAGSGDEVLSDAIVAPFLTVRPQSCAPFGPSKLSPKSFFFTSSDTTTFKWKALKSAASYTFEFDDNAAFSSPSASPIGANTTHTPVFASYGKYFWRARASADDGFDFPSLANVFYYTIQTSPKPNATGSDTSTTFKWVAYPGATSYTLYLDNNEDCSSAFFFSTPTPDLAITLGPQLGSYFWCVQPDNGPMMPGFPITVE